MMAQTEFELIILNYDDMVNTGQAIMEVGLLLGLDAATLSEWVHHYVEQRIRFSIK